MWRDGGASDSDGKGYRSAKQKTLDFRVMRRKKENARSEECGIGGCALPLRAIRSI